MTRPLRLFDRARNGPEMKRLRSEVWPRNLTKTR